MALEHPKSGYVDKGTQIQLMLRYQELLRTGAPLPAFVDVEFRNHSQNGEDGILLYVFSLVGTTNRRCVEICAGDGMQCNTANLVINHNFQGLLVDGDEKNVQAASTFYKNHPDTFAFFAPACVQAWITRESINDLLRTHHFTGEIDLLSLDIDGNDYHVWEALDAVSPRIVILEYDNAFGPEDSRAMRYDPNFVVRYEEPGLPHNGASLAAFTALGRRKGYRLVGSQFRCFNAIFLRDDVGVGILPEVTVASCLSHPLSQLRQRMLLDRSDSPVLRRFEKV